MMEFWIFMFFNNLFIPILMILVGGMTKKHPPKTINDFFGYRTPMSRKNQETWEFANRYCGALWQKIGRWELLTSVLIQIPFIGASEDTIGFLGIGVIVVQTVLMLLSILMVERKLKETFDRDGRRKS